MNLLYITHTVVDTEHILPLYVFIGNNFKDVGQNLCALNLSPGTIYGDSGVGTYLPESAPLSCFRVAQGPVRKQALRFLALVSDAASTIVSHTVEGRQRVVRAGIIKKWSRCLVNRIAAGTQGDPSCGFDAVVIPANVFDAVLHAQKKSTTAYYALLKPLLLNTKVKKYVVPETYDPFPETMEFGNESDLLIGNTTRFLSRGDINKVSPHIPAEKVLALGTPRYSENWCNELWQRFKANERLSENKTVLYMPTKLSRAYPGMKELIAEMDRAVFSLLDRFDDLHLIVKPHPRTFDYKNIALRTSHTDRVTVIRNVNTITLADASDIVITPGTSFIPQLLWMQKPVILLDHLTDHYHYSYHMAPYCSRLSDFHELYRSTDSPSPVASYRQKLIDFFQCGHTGANYEAFLKKQLAALF